MVTHNARHATNNRRANTLRFVKPSMLLRPDTELETVRAFGAFGFLCVQGAWTTQSHSASWALATHYWTYAALPAFFLFAAAALRLRVAAAFLAAILLFFAAMRVSIAAPSLLLLLLLLLCFFFGFWQS